MFEQLSYIGYTLLFCVPPFILMWFRREFYLILKKALLSIFVSTLLLTAFGSLAWVLALKRGAWSYHPERFTGVRLLDLFYLDDIVWWAMISFLFSSFIVLSRKFEERGINLFFREIKVLLVSISHAFRGFKTITLERNSTVHLAVAVFVVLEGVLFNISTTEWFFAVLAIGAVLALELVNSSIERLASKASREWDLEIRIIKDTAAAAVLVASIAAAIIGFIIFFRRFLQLLR